MIKTASNRSGVCDDALLALSCMLFSATATAASDLSFRQELAIARIYDSNVFFTADGEGERQMDVLTRVSPLLGATLESPTLNLTGSVGIDAEEYHEYETLNSSHNRQFGGLSLEYLASEKLTLLADADYMETMTPGELNLNSGLEPGRVNASRSTINPALNYRFTPQTEGTLEARLTRDRLDGGVEGDTREVSMQVDQASGPRNVFSYAYRYRDYQFSQQPGEGIRTHLAKLGWSHQFSERTDLTVEGGARFSSASTDPYYSLSLRHNYGNGSIDFNYGLDEVSLIGETGRFETETAAVQLSHRFGPDLELNVTPAYGQVRSDVSNADVFRVDMSFDYHINSYLSFVTSYQHYDYRGQGFGTDFERTLTRKVILMGIEISYPGRSR